MIPQQDSLQTILNALGVGSDMDGYMHVAGT